MKYVPLSNTYLNYYFNMIRDETFQDLIVEYCSLDALIGSVSHSCTIFTKEGHAFKNHLVSQAKIIQSEIMNRVEVFCAFN